MISKPDLVKVVRDHLGGQVSLAQAERTVAAVIEAIKRGVRDTTRVRLLGFGTFRIVARRARAGVNPKTRAKIRIKASNTIKFVAGKAFKELL